MGKFLKILFLCTGNSCRSQMAQGWARQLKSDIVQAASAGTRPGSVDPRAVKVMAEAGVDIADQYSKHLDELKGRQFDYVITLCGSANESCPVFPAETKVVHVGFEDPPKMAANAETEEQAIEAYREVRDQIRGFVAGLPESLESEN